MTLNTRLERWALPLILLCGFWLGLIHPPFSLPWVGILALPMAVFLARSTPRKALAGYLFGLGYFAVSMSWISAPFAIGPEVYSWMAYPAWALMAAGLALFWLPVFLLLDRGVWSFAVIFGVMEILRGHIFTGLPWALLAYGFVDTPLAQSASIIGAYGLSVGIALAAVCLVEWKRPSFIGTGLFLIVVGFVFSWMRGEPDYDEFAKLKVMIVQPNISVHDRQIMDDVDQLETLIGLSQGEGDIVIWPEVASPYAPTHSPELMDYLNENLPNKTLIFGAPSFDDGLFYNSAYELRPNGEFYRYDKIHLVPFGEYIPFADWLLERQILVQTVTQFNARKGDKRDYPNFASPRPNILICYEGIFPVMSRREGDYLALITNDDWFGERSGPYQHLIAAQFRAIENGKPVLRSALTGISAMIDAKGRVVASLDLGEKGVIVENMGASFEGAIYRAWGDWPLWLGLALGVFMLTVARPRA